MPALTIRIKSKGRTHGSAPTKAGGKKYVAMGGYCCIMVTHKEEFVVLFDVSEGGRLCGNKRYSIYEKIKELR